MRSATERRHNQRNLSIKDLDRFDDLTWEEDLFGRFDQNSSEGRQAFNLTSRIEEYLRARS